MAALQHIETPERGVLLLDTNLKITRANRRAAEVFGTEVADLVGSELPASVGRRPSQPEAVIEEVMENVLMGTAIIHRHSSPVYDSDGQPAGRVEIYSDITARRELEREIIEHSHELARLNTQLREAQEQLIQSERLRTLGEMAAGVAHDINNVLGIILGNVQLAKRRLDADSALAECISAIELAARDAAETVRRLREIGRPADISHHCPVDLSVVVDDVIRTAVPAWREHHHGASDIAIGVRHNENCTVNGSPVEIREALANVLLNAVQATTPPGIIDVSVESEADWISLVVRDYGVGMNKETRDRLFDPFFTTRGADGTGLGMSMVDAIMIRHGGRVLVDSEEGKGTTVTLRFPAHPVPSA